MEEERRVIVEGVRREVGNGGREQEEEKGGWRR